MKKILLLLTISVSFLLARSQEYVKVSGSWMYDFLGSDSALIVPNDTLADAPINSISMITGVLYYKGTTGHWYAISGSGGSGAIWGENITGNILNQLDLVNLVNQRIPFSDSALLFNSYLSGYIPFSDSAHLLAPYALNVNVVKYSDTPGILSPYLLISNFTASNIGLGNVLNRKQVINLGGWDSVGVYAFSALPAASVGPTFAYVSDTNAFYHNNGTGYTKIAGGSGGGGGGGDDSTLMLSKHQATLLYVPLTSFNLAGITAAQGFQSYSNANPSGFISGNQSISFAPTGPVIVGAATGSTSLTPALTIAANQVVYSMLQQNPAKTILGNQNSSAGNNGAVYIGSGLLWNVDTLKSDTSLLATQSFVFRQGFLTSFTETDPIATAKTITINTTTGKGLILTGTPGQTLGTSPAWSLNADTGFLATVSSLSRQGFLKTETDPIATAKTITFTQGRGILLSNVTSQTIGSNPLLTIASDTTVMASQYYVGNQGFLKSFTESDPIANARVITLNGTANRGIVVTGTAGQALNASPLWGLAIDTTYAATKHYANTTFLPLNGNYHLFFRSQNTTAASAGDTGYVSGHDSTITIAGIVDSLNFHHSLANGRLVMWSTGGGGGGITADTLSLFQSITATGDTLKGYNSSQPKFLGAQVFIPSYVAKVSSGLMSAAKGARLDSTVTVEWGHGGHHIFRAPWTKDSLMGKDINLVDTSGTLAITLLGPAQNRDSTYVLTFNISAANLATTSSLTSGLALKSNIASPTFTGIPAGPTATLGTNTTQFATTAFVQAAISGSGSGVTTVLPFSSASQTNGATISGVNILFGPADTTNSGMVTTGQQMFSGVKTFTRDINANGFNSTGTMVCGACLMEWNNNSTAPTAFFSAGLYIPGGSLGTDWYLSSYNGTAWSGVMHAYQGGQIQHMKYGTHSFSGTLAYGLGEDASGNMIELTKGIDFAPGTSALVTGILKNTTGTGALSIAVVSDFPILNQSTSGTAANLSGTPALPNGVTATTQSVGDNSLKLATTAYVANATAPYALLASPSFTGVPAVPTAAQGTSTSQAASTAFVATYFSPLTSPSFTGTPLAPTAPNTTNTTQIATTAFVQNSIAGLASLASPTFTGTPIAPTATTGTNTTQIATTAFVQVAIAQSAPISADFTPTQIGGIAVNSISSVYLKIGNVVTVDGMLAMNNGTNGTYAIEFLAPVAVNGAFAQGAFTFLGQHVTDANYSTIVAPATTEYISTGTNAAGSYIINFTVADAHIHYISYHFSYNKY